MNNMAILSDTTLHVHTYMYIHVALVNRLRRTHPGDSPNPSKKTDNVGKRSTESPETNPR